MATASLTLAKFFPGHHPALTEQLGLFLNELRRQLEARGDHLRVASLILAGGYGRGEGGVLIDANNNAHLYNDLEFYLFTDGSPSPILLRLAEEMEHAGKKKFGIEVEIKTLPSSWLDAAGPSMFLYDLVNGHIMVFGPEDFLTRDEFKRFCDPAAIPLHEAARLLFNRGSGLLFAGAKLSGIDPQFDVAFIQRNHAKLKLALGDAVLAANGLYRSSCRERDRLMTSSFTHKPPCWEEVRRIHAAGVGFKLNPHHDQPPRLDLEQQQKALLGLWTCVFLWLETRRLGVDFPTLRDYATFSGRILPEFCVWKNPALRLRDFLRHRELLTGLSDYPRGVLQRALAAFLSGPEGGINAGFGARVLGVCEPKAFDTYRRWWSRYN